MTKREVRLEGGAPWGFRMNGGSDSGHPLRISRVNPGSKAAQQGVREGDVISAINGTATRLLTNGDSHALLKSAGSSLTLGLNQDNTSSPKRRSRDLNKRENSAGSSQELNRLNDELDQPKSASSTSSSEPKKQGKKSKPSRTLEEEEGKGESTDKNECEADGEQKEEGEGNLEECVENGKKISSSKARRLRKSRAKRKIITSDHLEITITENTEASDTRIEAVDNNVLNDTSCDIAVSNDESHIPSDKTVSISNIEDLKSVRDINVGNTNSDTQDEKRISISNNKELNIDKDITLPPSMHTLPNTEINVANDSNTKVYEPNSPKVYEFKFEPSSKDEGLIKKVEGEPEKTGKIKKKSKKCKPLPLNLECTSSPVAESGIENKIENSPESSDTINSPETSDRIKSSNFEEEEIKVVQVLNETVENTEEEIKNVPTLNNVTSQSEVENDAGLEKAQSSRGLILEGSIIKKKKKHKSKSSKSVKVETVEQSSSFEPSDGQLENMNETMKNDAHEGSIVENSSSIPGYEADFKIHRGFKEEETSSIDSAEKSGQVINSNEVAVKPSNKKSKSKSTKSKITKDIDGIDFSTGSGNGDNSSNLSETSKTSAVDFPSNIIDLTKSDSHFLHIESSTSNVFNEEVDTDCLKLSSLSRDEARSPVELVLNPPTPTLASEETFFGPDWESVEEIKSTDLGSSKTDVGKKVSVHDSSNSDLRAEVNNLVIVEDFGDDMGLTVDDIRTPIIPPDEEKKLRSFLETLDLVKPDSDYEDDYDIGKDSKEEIVVYRHCTRRSSAEPCYIPPPHRHYLDVITEENSDLSDTDRKSDCDKPWENPELIKKNNDIDEIPDDWGDSDQEVEYPSEEDGGIKTWNGCGTLEEVEGVEIVYLDSDNSDETIIDDRNRELGENEPKLVVCKTTEMGKRQKIDSSPILVSAENITVMIGESQHEKDTINKVRIIGDERIVEENRNEKPRIDRNFSPVVSNEMKVQSEGNNDDKYIGKENPISRVIVKETDSQVDEPVNKNSVSRFIVEEKELQVDKPIVDENHISKVIVKEKELKVDGKAQIDLINTIPKSSELVKACDKIDNCKQDARRRFFSNETCLEKESDRENVSNITPVSVAVSKTFIDQSVEGTNKSRIEIDSKRQNANKDSKLGVGNLDDYEFIIENNGRDGSNKTKSEEGRNFSKSVSDEGWEESRTILQQPRINTKSVQSRNFNNNLETLDLIKVCAKSDGDDRSDSENIYEYIEFRKESDSKVKEDCKEIDSSITNDGEIVVPRPQVKVDVTATPILSRQNSSSSGTMSTQCTSKFNQSPSAWSSENEEKPAIKESSKMFVGNDPESLRELSTKKVISLPNGLRLLEDIGIIQFRSCLDGDQNCFYQNVSGVVSPDLTYPPSRPTSVSGSYFHKRHSFSPKSCSVLYTPPRSVVTSPPCSLPPDRERWIGIPTASQNTFVCFSPSQTKSTPLPPGPQEAAGLLDLHKKFIARRGYHEDRWRESSSDLQSPDLIRLEQYSAPVKQRDYTPELLAEAANLLALKEYRESRCLDSKSPDLDTNYDDENKAMKFTIDEVMKIRENERNASPSYNPRSDSKYKTKAISENSRRPNEIGRMNKEGAIPPYNLRNENESTLKLINEDVNKFVRLNRNKESEPTSYVFKNSQEFSTRENNKHKETFYDISKINQGGRSSCYSINGGKNKTSIMNEDVEMLNELLKELDIDDSIVDNKRSSTTSTRELKSSIGKHENLDEKFDNGRHKTHNRLKNFEGGGDNMYGNIKDDRYNKTETFMKKFKEERDDRQKTNKNFECSKDNDLIRNDTQKSNKLSEGSRENDLFETFEWIEGETNQGLVQNLIAKLEKAASGVEGDGGGERAKATESSDDRSRLLALIQSQNDRSVGVSLCDGELQLDATCNRRHCNTICGKGRRRSTGSGEMTRGDDERGRDNDDDHSQGDSSSRVFDADDYKISKRGDIAVIGDNNGSLRRPERPKSLPPGTSGSGTEMFRQKMYEEYMEQVAERFERRQQKVIRLSRPASLQVDDSSNRDSSEALNLEDEFMVKVRERMSKLGINLDDENNNAEDCGDESLPKHLQEFAQLGDDGDGVWSPAQTPEAQRKAFDFASTERDQREDEERERDKSPQPVVWTPKSVPSPTPERKSYRPVKFESPPPVRKNPPKSKEDSPKPPTSLPLTPADWSKSTANRSTTFHSETTTDVEQRLTSSQSADSSLAFSTEINLPRAPNPTITLLQKAREGQLPRGAHYLEGEDETASIASEDSRRPHIVPNEIIYTVKKEYCSEGEDKKPKKIVELGPRKFEGIGPTTKEGIPIVLRSEVKDTNQQKWYKRMYDSLHKAEGDKYVTVRYRSNKKDQYPYASAGGYLSEPDRLGYDSDLTSSKYATLDRRRIRNKEKDFTTCTMPRSKYVPDNSVKKPVDVYKNQPGRIEDYEPGRSSISEKEAKQWWDEVLDIFDEQFEQAQNTNRPPPTTPNTGKPFMTYALKESGYESDSTLVFKRRDENLQNQQAMSPAEQKMAYKTIQKGGEVPLHGLRKPAPERPKDESDLEYFPISPHLTRIRIHKSKQTIRPQREIICYPITSITTDNPPPVFSTFKRTARPSVALSRSRSPDKRPPSPPKRRSSRSSSTLRLYSKVTPPVTTHLSRTSSGLEVDSNVQYLKERITNKLTRKPEYSASQVSTRPTSITSKYSIRRESPSPGVRTTTRSTSNVSASSSRKITDRKSVPITLRSRKDLSSSKLNISPDLRAPAEVKKALKDREIKEKSNVSYTSAKDFPPGTLVKSSTAFYSSNKDGKRSKEDKALRVTVAISAKGRELLRSPSVSRSSPTKENGYTSPKRPETPLKRSDRDVKSPSPSSIKSSSSKSKINVSSESINRPKAAETTQSATKVKATSSGKTSPVSTISLDQSKKLKKSVVTPDVVTKKKKEKSVSSSVSKPISMFKSLTSRKTSGDKAAKEQNGKKKSKKKTEEGVADDNKPKKAKKSVSKTKVKEKEEEGEKNDNQSDCGDSTIGANSKLSATVDNNLEHELVLDPVTDSKALQPLRSDSFFQHLFLRDAASSPTPSHVSSVCNPSTVLERAKKFCEVGEGRRRMSFKSEPSLKLLSVYLNNKKPVTESKFRSLDKDIMSGRSSRSLSPYYCRGRSFEFFERLDKFDRMNNVWDKTNSVILSPSLSRNSSPACESVKERSSSEPPPSSPIHDATNPYWEAEETISPSLSRSPSCRRIRNARTMTRTIESIGGLKRKGVRAKSVGESDNKKPLSPLHAQSTSSLNLSSHDHNDYQGYFIELLHSTKKSDRFRELHKFYSSLERMEQLERTTSNTDLRPRMRNEEVIDYDRWKSLRTKERAEEELKVLYEKLKEDQKEKGLLFRPREPEAFRWRREQDMGLRNREKSVEDLKNQYYRLTAEDFDFDDNKRKEFDMKKDVYKPLWRGSSVVNLAHSLTTSVSSHRGRPVSFSEQNFSSPRPVGQKYTRSIGSRLWSSLSMEQVNALKSQLSEIYSTVSNLKRERINRMIEGTKERKPKEDYEISVVAGDVTPCSSSDVLHVRCNSLLSSEQLYSPLTRKKEARRSEVVKADSISSIPQLKESKSGSSGESQASSVITKPLSENEKRRLSMTLSQEVLDRVNKKDEKRKKKRNTASLVIPRETLGAVAAIKGHKKIMLKKSPTTSETTNSPRTCYSIEMSEDSCQDKQTSSLSPKSKNNFLLVLTPKDDNAQEVKKVVDKWANTSAQHTSQEELDDNQVTAKMVLTSNSETDSGSSEASTVIHLGSRESVLKKEEAKSGRREMKKDKNRVSRSDGDVSLSHPNPTKRACSAPGVFDVTDQELLSQITKMPKLSSSQSFTDLKELFGEQKATIYTVPKQPAPVQVTDLDEESDVKCQMSPVTSDQMSARSRSISPDPMRYYRAYLSMVKAGDVRKLREKFESFDDLFQGDNVIQMATLKPVKKFQSDPDLTREYFSRCSADPNKTVVKGQELGDVQWLKSKYEKGTKHRSRQRCRRVVSPVPLRAEDRFMPHINVISKMAALQQQKRSSTAPPRPDMIYRTGEVDRIRQQFEEKQHELSLLGQMYTSTPDVRELRDIAPYLECQWIAHQHPKPRSLSSPETPRSAPRSPAKMRPSSASPTRSYPSILKPKHGRWLPRDPFANQPFDPSIHRPLYRYQPPVNRSADAALHYRPWRADPHWWWRNLYNSTKPSVTFQEPISGGPVPVPERSQLPKRRSESPHRYVESEVTIHYKSPVRAEAKEALSEEELAQRQAETMRRIYQEERRRKYLQELQDMYSRRHTDNFIPSQKSPIPLNRYDDFPNDSHHSTLKSRDRTPEPKLVARALYNFVGQSSRELTFRRGDIIYVRRQIDKNWFEGEHNAMIGLFPLNHVEIIPYDGIRSMPKRSSEGQARAKFNFQAQTHLELSLVKGELVVLTRRVDENWFEGRIGNRKGIFPVSYVEVLVEPGERAVSPVRPTTPASSKPVASPASHSMILNGGRNSSTHHHYTPPPPVSYTSLSRPTKTSKQDLAPVNQALHIDTQSEPVPYRALYNYKPQNDDELELNEGDLVYVMEKCDDGWYVGSSQRTACFGTFPGNYVQRLPTGAGLRAYEDSILQQKDSHRVCY